MRPATCAAAVLVLVTACSGGPPSPQPSTPSISSRSSGPTSFPPARAVAPLTGLPVDAVARRPALMVKVENSSAARPQSGLDRADLVVEELVEGGITRFAAVFQSRDPGTVGPVRSLRDVDASLAGPTRGLLASSGAASVVLRRLRGAPVQLMMPSRTSSAYFRTSARQAPHNLYARARLLWSYADAAHRFPPKPYLPFAAAAAYASTAAGAAGVRPARRADLWFSQAARPSWTYDARSGRWLRSEGSTPSRTASGARLAATNVVVLQVRTRDAGYRDPVGNPVPETVLTGSGRVTVLSDGRRVSGTWRKAGRSAALTFTSSTGQPLLLAPGTTWLELVPTSGSASVS